MSNPRVKRLQNDYDKMRALESSSQYVTIEGTDGNPPDKYVVQLTCRSITSINGSQPVYGSFHRMGIDLHTDYPRKGPLVVMLTSVFNPNVFGNGVVCIGDKGDHGWAPSMGLDDLVVRVIETLRYEPETVNPNSPANGIAADWMKRQNGNMFPLETGQIRGADIFGAIEFLEDDLDIEIW